MISIRRSINSDGRLLVLYSDGRQIPATTRLPGSWLASGWGEISFAWIEGLNATKTLHPYPLYSSCQRKSVPSQWVHDVMQNLAYCGLLDLFNWRTSESRTNEHVWVLTEACPCENRGQNEEGEDNSRRWLEVCYLPRKGGLNLSEFLASENVFLSNLFRK